MLILQSKPLSFKIKQYVRYTTFIYSLIFFEIIIIIFPFQISVLQCLNKEKKICVRGIHARQKWNFFLLIYLFSSGGGPQILILYPDS